MDWIAQYVGLQEALEAQKNELQIRLGDDYDFYNFQSANGNPILLRKEIFNVIASEALEHPISCVIERYINYVVLQQISTGHLFVLHNTKFCPLSASFPANELDAEARNQDHAQTLAQFMDNNSTQYSAPVIALGDLNTSSSSSIQFLLGQGSLGNGATISLELNDTYSIANPSIDRTTASDWIIASSGLTVKKNGRGQ